MTPFLCLLAPGAQTKLRFGGAIPLFFGDFFMGLLALF
jgi:hypothetical protein